jgi:acetyl-CoA carboxylase biotin carboxylase subunit
MQKQHKRGGFALEHAFAVTAKDNSKRHFHRDLQTIRDRRATAADRDSLPAQLADEAICIGPSEARRSYLSAPAVISAALMTGCDAIHPGYGFLSEDEGFAEVVAAHGLTFIGPPAAVLERFASKAGTRQLLGAHGLPTIPGSDGMLRDEMHALDEAERIGYPVLVKPSAGGGGKGMRMVRTPRELESVLRVCRSEAKAAFGDDGSISRRWLDENRHVEVQVATTAMGTGSTCSERDCSVQLHQKILEEAPPALSDAARLDLAERAVRAAISAGYENVGTLEFLVDATGDFYFIEINSRIQVEHPVTEMLTGLDLVTTQIRIAAGEPLGFSQADVTMRGHAIEFRINAADPAHDFRPGAGSSALPRPWQSRRRMDSHLYSGYEGCRPMTRCSASSSSGDPIVHRHRAGRVALDELVVEARHNVAIHQAAANETFLSRMTTNLLDRVGGAAFLTRGARIMSSLPCRPAQTAPQSRHGRQTDPHRLELPVTDTVHTIREIEALIPHRWPFLLVDRIVEYAADAKRIVGIKGVTASEWYFQGHFPGLPVMPGVIQVEALAQTMAVYVAKQPGFGDRIGLFAGVDDCRFKRVVSPGDTLRLKSPWALAKCYASGGAARSPASLSGNGGEECRGFGAPGRGATR